MKLRLLAAAALAAPALALAQAPPQGEAPPAAAADKPAAKAGDKPAAKQATSPPPSRGKAAAKPAAGAVATVNGVAVPHSRIDLMMRQQAQRGGQDNAQMRALMREELINRELIAQEAGRTGIAKNADVQAQLDLVRQEIVVGAYIRDWVGKHPITDADMQKEYDRAKAQAGDKEYNARHILLESEDQAKGMIAELKKGGKFDELATKNSKDGGTATRGGDLDWNVPGAYDQAFSDAMVNSKGQVHRRAGADALRLPRDPARGRAAGEVSQPRRSEAAPAAAAGAGQDRGAGKGPARQGEDRVAATAEEIHREQSGAGAVFLVVRGDLLEEPVDAIVNAANGHLAHGGGVAGIIARAAGPALQAESDRLVRDHGPFPTGSAVATTAGKLPFKGVIHAVGPRFGEGDEELKLVQAPSFLMEMRAGRGWASVSFPAVSSGIFPVPLDICSRAYLRPRGRPGWVRSGYACATNRSSKPCSRSLDMKQWMPYCSPACSCLWLRRRKRPRRRRSPPAASVHRGGVREGAGRDPAVSGYIGGTSRTRPTSRCRAASPATRRR